MFRTCFVAALSDRKPRTVDTICQYTPSPTDCSNAELPSAANLGSFCFPNGPDNVKQREYMAPVEFSFTLTGGDGSRLHGFCRSYLPPRKRSAAGQSSSMRYPQVLCLISPHPFFALYYKALQVVEALLKQSDLLTSAPCSELPLSAPASFFLEQLCREAGQTPVPGRVIRLTLPPTPTPINVSPPRRLGRTDGTNGVALQSTERWIDLEIPPDSGNGSNAGIPLARLLWALPVPQVMALLEALLLEKRVLLIGPEPDTVSAATHAAAALLYPFRWVHIFVPLLPHALKDYLLAPMPFLVGLPASHAVVGLARIPLDDVVVVDLELGSVRQGLQGPPLYANHLPWTDRLQSALQMVHGMMRSPTEYESTPMIAGLMQEYMLRLMMRYVDQLRPEGLAPSQDGSRGLTGSPLAGGRCPQRPYDGFLRAHGYVFDHNAFVASQRRGSKARDFLDMFRHSQMYEQFITERLQWAAGGTLLNDPFEAKVAAKAEMRSRLLGQQIKEASMKSATRLSEVVRKTSHMVKAMRQGDGEAMSFAHRMGKLVRPPRSPAQMPSLHGSPPARPLPVGVSGAEQDPATWFSDLEDSDSDTESVSSVELPFVLRAHRQGAAAPHPESPLARRTAIPAPEGSGGPPAHRAGSPMPQQALPLACSQRTAAGDSSTAAIGRALLSVPSLMDADFSPIWVTTQQKADSDGEARQLASVQLEGQASFLLPQQAAAPTPPMNCAAMGTSTHQRSSSSTLGVVAPTSVAALDPFADLLSGGVAVEEVGRRKSTAMASELAREHDRLPVGMLLASDGLDTQRHAPEVAPAPDGGPWPARLLASAGSGLGRRRSTYEWSDWAGPETDVPTSSGHQGLVQQASLLDL